MISPNEIQFYLARNADLHPLLYATFLEQLEEMAHKQKLSLLPATIFETYHRRLQKSA